MINEFKALLNLFSSNKKTLTLTFEILNVENKGVQFEGILHLSVFVLNPNTNKLITRLIRSNQKNINAFLNDFEPALKSNKNFSH